MDEQRKENQTEIDPEKKYVMENRLAKGHLATNYREGKKQPENNQVRKDMAEKEWEKTNWAQKDRTTMDDKEECNHNITQEENGKQDARGQGRINHRRRNLVRNEREVDQYALHGIKHKEKDKRGYTASIFSLILSKAVLNETAPPFLCKLFNKCPYIINVPSR